MTIRAFLCTLQLQLLLGGFVHAAENPFPADTAAAERKIMIDESIEQLLPLRPEEVRQYVQQRDSVEGAVEPGPAKMVTETRQLHTTPGGIPQVVRLTQGYSSTLVFQDSTGAPWPVLTTILGSSKTFQVAQPKVESSDSQPTQNVHANLINLIPLTSHASSNLVITLEGAPYPVIVHLLTESAAKSRRTSDALVVFRMDKPGPNANVPKIGPSAPTTVSTELLSFVHGVPPEGALGLNLDPLLPNVKMWEFKGNYYLRTPFAAVWPAWHSIANGEDICVYVMPKTPSIVVSVNGIQTKLMVGTNRGRQ